MLRTQVAACFAVGGVATRARLPLVVAMVPALARAVLASPMLLTGSLLPL